MHRRTFIRLAGGGAVVAAGGGLQGCSTDYPPQAVAPWQGPGNEADLRRWALGYAILAPNSHNRQPWIVDLRQPNTITLHVDRERLLPMTDPWFRQIVVSQGTFIEALVMALKERGVDPQVRLFPDGPFKAREVDDRPVAQLSWAAGAPAPARDPLFAQILRRHTAKVEYDVSRPVPATALEQLRSALVDTTVSFGGTVDAQRLEPLRTLCWESARVELTTARTVMESVRLTRVGPAEIERHRDGISINEWLPRLAAMVGAFDRENPPAEGSAAYKQMMGRFEGHSRTAMGFVWLSTANGSSSSSSAGAGAATSNTRSAEVNAGRAYMRLQLKATEIGLQVHPMSQAPQEFAEMATHRDRLHQLLLGQPASEAVVQMFCRVGYCAQQQHTPRRSVSAIIRG